MAQFPDVPTVREQGIDLSVRKFRGLAGPKGTPPEAVAALEAAVPRLLDDPDYKAIYTKNSLEPGFIPHAEYGRFIDEFGRQTEAFLKESGVIE
jgi:tripartite-type tricarboxylate transporter receptor subunit TctC